MFLRISDKWERHNDIRDLSCSDNSFILTCTLSSNEPYECLDFMFMFCSDNIFILFMSVVVGDDKKFVN